MASLYHIEEELLRIFSDIEENDGEISEEMFAKLELTRENLIDKLDKYVKAIKSWDGEVAITKEESKKLLANAKVKENRVKRLKAAMLNAVLLFGNEGKTNKFIDLPTVKLFTKATPSVEVNEERINKFITEFERFIRELVSAGALYTGSDVDMQGILDSINANLKAEHELAKETIGINGPCAVGDYEPYSITDLKALRINITTTQTIYQLFTEGRSALELYGNNHLNTSMRDATSKEDWKIAISNTDMLNDKLDKEDERYVVNSTIAKLVKNQSIQMR